MHQVSEKLKTIGSSKNSRMLVGMEHLLGRRLAEDGGQTGSQEPDDEGRSVLCGGACLVSSSQEAILDILSTRMSPTGLQFGREQFRGREARLEIKGYDWRDGGG